MIKAGLVVVLEGGGEGDCKMEDFFMIVGVRNVAATQVVKVVIGGGHSVDVGGECIIKGKSKLAKICCGSVGDGVVREVEKEFHGCVDRLVVKLAVLVGRLGPPGRIKVDRGAKAWEVGTHHGQLGCGGWRSSYG